MAWLWICILGWFAFGGNNINLSVEIGIFENNMLGQLSSSPGAQYFLTSDGRLFEKNSHQKYEIRVINKKWTKKFIKSIQKKIFPRYKVIEAQEKGSIISSHGGIVYLILRDKTRNCILYSGKFPKQGTFFKVFIKIKKKIHRAPLGNITMEDHVIIEKLNSGLDSYSLILEFAGL